MVAVGFYRDVFWFNLFLRAYPRAREVKVLKSLWLLGIWSLSIGNRTAVLLNRLFLSERGGIVIDVKKGFHFLHDNGNV